MNILIACEFSGRVRDAFTSRGHRAVSADLLPSETPGPHYQGDVFDILNMGWDMMIAFPPCDHLANSGARWFEDKRADGRQHLAIGMFLQLAHANIPRIAIENPVGVMSKQFRKPDQIIQPWEHGHGETKATCLWLKNLPPLSGIFHIRWSRPSTMLVGMRRRWPTKAGCWRNSTGGGGTATTSHPRRSRTTASRAPTAARNPVNRVGTPRPGGP